jgi:chemotaxis protein methyltransferase CheR
MRFKAEPFSLPESIFTILRDLIHEHTGLYYENNQRTMLGEKLSPRLLERDLDSFLDYYYLLKYDINAYEEWNYLMDLLSVQETFFWREIDQVQVMVDILLPQLLELPKFRYQAVRIWCAACATGEEPLSIAIALQEKGWFDKVAIEIYASDGSQKAITQAKKGIYRERSFRTLPEYLKQKYFQKIEGGWQIQADIHKRVEWSLANLMKPNEIHSLTHGNFIFCRNVFIYFSEESIKETVSLFYKGISSPGYLFVGAAESLLKITKQFDLQEIGGAFVYVKK